MRRRHRELAVSDVVVGVFVVMQLLLVGVAYIKLSHVQEAISPIVAELSPVLNRLDSSEKNFGLGKALERDMDPKYLLGIHALWAALVHEMEERLVFINPKTQELMEGVLDVSTFSEFTFLWKRMLLRHQGSLGHGTNPVVVDVGAMDGLSGSNSYNFVQMGWSAVLIEPNPRHIRKIRSNHFRHFARNQKIDIFEGVIGPEAGNPSNPTYRCKNQTLGKRCVQLCLRQDEASATSSTILGNPEFSCTHIEVASFLASEVGESVDLPRHFEVLDIDAEGVGDIVLQQFLEAGYRPLFILYETSHGLDDTDERLLAAHSYVKIRDMGNDHIWELQDTLSSSPLHRGRVSKGL